MPGAILHAGAVVTCGHAPPGPATPGAPSPRVKVGGRPVVTIGLLYSVSGCSNPASAGGPCVTGTWLEGAARVRIFGRPVAIATGTSRCAPNGAPLVVKDAQRRAMATSRNR